MKPLLLFILTAFSLNNAFAQVKAINPLSCFTWGPDQFLSYEEVKRIGQTDPDVAHSYKASEAEYNAYGQYDGAYAWIPEDERYLYINNVQVVRWNVVEGRAPGIISVTNIFDEVLYSVSTENSCGVIIFPDSLAAENDFIFIKIKAVSPYTQEGPRPINSSYVTIHPRKKEERLALLKELQACNNLECKVEKLKAHHATLDLLSLLELEKMKDRQNKAIDKLYWETVSLIRYKYPKSAER